MSCLPRGSVLVVGAAPVRYMAGIVPFPYRPDSDLIYLTGCCHPGVVAVIESDGGSGSGASNGGTRGPCKHFALLLSPQPNLLFHPLNHIQNPPQVAQLPPPRSQTNLTQMVMVVWDGRALDPPAATAFFKPDRAMFVDSLHEYLLQAQQRISAHRLSSSSSLPSSFSSDRSPPPRFYCDHRANRDLIATVPVLAAELATGRLLSSRSALDEQRWIKSEAEQRLMRRAAEITAEAFLAAMRQSAAVAAAGRGGAGGRGGGGSASAATYKEGHIRGSLPHEGHIRGSLPHEGHIRGSLPHEGHISALIEFECKRRGAQRFAYPPVVAGGSSGCIVHYLRNDKPVQPGEALLVDAGCEYFGYASDITRVWPPSGKFSAAQRAVYEAVREAMVECIAMCRPGATLRDMHQHSVISLSSALVQLGVCQGSAQQVARGAFRQFYPTSVGHWLGLDTHDCASVSSFQPLKPGVVLTIEPGLYLPDIDQVPKHLRGIGVRIEDDILITADGYENLTAAVPADVDALEVLIVLALTVCDINSAIPTSFHSLLMSATPFHSLRILQHLTAAVSANVDALEDGSGDRALPSIGGIKKKKKKAGKAVNLDSLQLQALRDAEAALKEEEARGGAAGLHESGAVVVGGAGGEEEGEQQAQEEAEDLRTPAERRYHEQLEKLEAERAARGASKSHRQRVEDFNKYLANLSEHHDIPKVGPG
ncbi:unnamed protein product [Closterium sp. Naga37s-1]|nr:unnamed protein product [Closterium sp. Naga37s-1]